MEQAVTIEIDGTVKQLYKDYGILLVKGAYEALLAPVAMKEYPKNESRLEDGVRIITTLPKKQSRNVTLKIVIDAKNEESYFKPLDSFINFISSGIFLLKVPTIKKGFYFVYSGCEQFKNSRQKIATFELKLIEPNPENRVTLT